MPLRSLRWLADRSQHYLKWVLNARIRTFLLAGALLSWLFCLPDPLFDQPISTVLLDREGSLLTAKIASDEQWRFPMADSLPSKYVEAVLLFEDQHFYYHPGVNPVSLFRAAYTNLRAGRIVNGGSTLSMQVIRLARNHPPRNFWQKIIEVWMATRLELTYRKKTILRYYASFAPFGGNVVGIEAASWRFFGKKPASLSWAEAALLAVLPNSPGLLHPGKGREQLLQKRNRLLGKLLKKGVLTDLEFELATEEPLPEKPLALPQWAPHLSDFLQKSHLSGSSDAAVHHTTLSSELQLPLIELLRRRHALYRGNEVHNIAAIIMEVATGEVLAYVGNAPDAGPEHGASVDMVRAPRSTGSILKPYLYAWSLQSGDILPNSLLEDIPTQFGQYKPENYRETYDGVVSARMALIRSLNIPFVNLLRQHGLDKFHYELKQLGLTTFKRPASHYGLSLILGGGEASLLEVTNSYACMARRLAAFYDRNGLVSQQDFRPPRFLLSRKPPKKTEVEQWIPSDHLLSPGAIWHSFLAMEEVERPNSAGEWELFRSNQRIAWKTGTSFGFRDAWAVGVNARYAVGIWVGNADGEGRPGLIGIEMAAPVLFEVFRLLPGGDDWFAPPYDNMIPLAVCKQSGYRAGPDCEADTLWSPINGRHTTVCSFHQLLHLDPSRQFQVNSSCCPPEQMIHQPWLVLDAGQEYYYRGKNPNYVPPPPYLPGCAVTDQTDQRSPLRLLYPRKNAQLFIPVEVDGQLSSVIFKAAHREPETTLHWHLDDQYVGSTQTFHQIALQPGVGKHRIAVVDQSGNRIDRTFEVIGKGH